MGGDIRSFFGKNAAKTDEQVVVDLSASPGISKSPPSLPSVAPRGSTRPDVDTAMPPASDPDVTVVDQKAAKSTEAPNAEAETKPAAKKKATGSAAVKRKSSTPSKSSSVRRKSSDPAPMLSEGADEAMELVREAIKSLPSQEDVAEGLEFIPEDQKWSPPDEPRNPAKGPVPVGHPDCLTGLTFVVTGVLECMQREKFTEFVKRHGGRVTGSVSGKTDFLVVGDKCGRSKVNKAAEKEVDLITEDGVWSLVRATEGLVKAEAEAAAATAGTNAGNAGNAATAAAPALPATTAPQPAAAAPTFRAAKNQELWVDKYKPKSRVIWSGTTRW